MQYKKHKRPSLTNPTLPTVSGQSGEKKIGEKWSKWRHVQFIEWGGGGFVNGVIMVQKKSLKAAKFKNSFV